MLARHAIDALDVASPRETHAALGRRRRGARHRRAVPEAADADPGGVGGAGGPRGRASRASWCTRTGGSVRGIASSSDGSRPASSATCCMRDMAHDLVRPAARRQRADRPDLVRQPFMAARGAADDRRGADPSPRRDALALRRAARGGGAHGAYACPRSRGETLGRDLPGDGARRARRRQRHAWRRPASAARTGIAWRSSAARRAPCSTAPSSVCSGRRPRQESYDFERGYQASFDGAIAHFVDCLASGAAFETDVRRQSRDAAPGRARLCRRRCEPWRGQRPERRPMTRRSDADRIAQDRARHAGVAGRPRRHGGQHRAHRLDLPPARRRLAAALKGHKTAGDRPQGARRRRRRHHLRQARRGRGHGGRRDPRTS